MFEIASISNAEIRKISLKALDYFKINPEANIMEENSLSVTKVLGSDGNPIYYLLYEKLGSGMYGSVFQGRALDIISGNLLANTDVAIKITDFSEGGILARVDRINTKKETEAEADILKDIGQFQGFSVGKRQKEIIYDSKLQIKKLASVEEAVVVMKLHPGRDISHKQHKNKFSYGSSTFAQLAAALCQSLENFHKNNIIHMDLKPANILWDAENNHVNIVDFNRAKKIPPGKIEVVHISRSDPTYMAPESTKPGSGFVFTKASDIYSLGRTLKEKFEIKLSDGNPLNLNNKTYLSYDQLLIRPFINKMTSNKVSDRPDIESCTQFFSRIKQKMDLDMEDPSNQLRLELSKKLIGFEVYANQLIKEIKSTRNIDYMLAKAGLIADKKQKYKETIQVIGTIVKALSTPEIDINLLKNNKQLKQPKANGFFSFKGRYNQLMNETQEVVTQIKPKV